MSGGHLPFWSSNSESHHRNRHHRIRILNDQLLTASWSDPCLYFPSLASLQLLWSPFPPLVILRSSLLHLRDHNQSMYRELNDRRIKIHLSYSCWFSKSENECHSDMRQGCESNKSKFQSATHTKRMMKIMRSGTNHLVFLLLSPKNIPLSFM